MVRLSDQGDEGNGRLLRFRVQQNSERLGKIEDWRTRVDEDRTAVKGELQSLHRDLATVGNAVEGMRRVLIGFALTIAGSSVVFAFSVLLATGKL